MKSLEISPSGSINILYIGYLNEGRGLESAVRMMKYLPDRVNLFLIGKGDKEEELQELSNDLKLSSQVHFEGWKKPLALQEYLKEAHLGLNLLEDRSVSYFYSLANKTFDYALWYPRHSYGFSRVSPASGKI